MLWGPDGVVAAEDAPSNPELEHVTSRIRISAATLGVAMMTLAAATPLAAQKAGLGFGGSIGANVPNGEFGDGLKTGLVASGFVGVGTGRFGLRGELFWSRSDLDNAVIRRVGNAVLPSDGVTDVSGDVVREILA